MFEDLVDWADFGADYGVSLSPSMDLVDWSSFSPDYGVSFSDFGDALSSVDMPSLSADYSYFNSDFYGPPSFMSADYSSLNPDFFGPPANMATPASDFDWLPSPVRSALGSNWAPLAAGALAYFQQKPMYDAAMKKSKADQAWEEEQRRRMRAKQATSDQINQRDPVGTANIGRIVGNRGSYTGFGAPTNYGRVNGTPVRRMFAAEGGAARLPGDYKPGVLNFIRYMMSGKKFPWEQNNSAEQFAPVAERIQEYGSGEQRRRRLDAMEEQAVQGRAKGGALGYLRGTTKGQDDKIPAALSDGEYVMDADVVSALGDGNNEAGAAALDKMRENIRRHKRSAPSSKIPPKAKKPERYLKKGAE